MRASELLVFGTHIVVNCRRSEAGALLLGHPKCCVLNDSRTFYHAPIFLPRYSLTILRLVGPKWSRTWWIVIRPHSNSAGREQSGLWAKIWRALRSRNSSISPKLWRKSETTGISTQSWFSFQGDEKNRIFLSNATGMSREKSTQSASYALSRIYC